MALLVAYEVSEAYALAGEKRSEAADRVKFYGRVPIGEC